MRIIVGGTGRKTGKTTLVCRILALSPGRRWTAVKVSHHAPDSGAPFEILEETGPGPSGDTRRYLAAGAARAFWLRGDLARALPALRALLDSCENWIVESTRAARLLQADLVLTAGSGPPPGDAALQALLGAAQPQRQPEPLR
jgi:molybdopterin-guanine dinucleotide biosynthesis protein